MRRRVTPSPPGRLEEKRVSYLHSRGDKNSLQVKASNEERSIKRPENRSTYQHEESKIEEMTNKLAINENEENSSLSSILGAKASSSPKRR